MNAERQSAAASAGGVTNASVAVPSTVVDGPLSVDVLAVTAADVVRSAGAWLFNRSRHGWVVNVFLVENYDGEALQILGARAFPMQSLSKWPRAAERPHMLAASADLIRRDERALACIIRALTQTGGRTVVWGGPPPKLERRLDAFRHHPTPAGIVFKAHAMRALTSDESPSAFHEDFRGRTTTMGPWDFDLIADRSGLSASRHLS